MKSAKLAPIILIAVAAFGLVLVMIYMTTSPTQSASEPLTSQTRLVRAPDLNKHVYIPVANKPPLPNNVYGIEMLSISGGGGSDLILKTGTAWLRRPAIWWPDVEPTEGVRNWNAPTIQMFDQEFINANQMNMKVLTVVRGTPPWAQKYPTLDCGPILESKLAAFGNFMYDLVRRYSVPPYNVMHYQLINEPDVSTDAAWNDHSPQRLLGCWGETSDAEFFGGKYYAKMLQAVYPRMKQANPQVKVVLGGLLLPCDPRILPVGQTKGCEVNAMRRHNYFLNGILAGGGKDYFDIVAFHSYDYFVPGSPVNSYRNKWWDSSAETTGPVVLRKLDYIKSVLAMYGASSKPIMNTETALLCECGVEDDHQRAMAFYAAQVYPTTIISNVLVTSWFRSLDGGNFNMGMISDKLVPRYAYTAFVASNVIIGPAAFDRRLTTADFGSVADVKGNAFSVRNRIVWTIWSTASSPRQITLPSMPLVAYDNYGKPIAIDESLTIELQSPDRLFVYIEYEP